MSYPGFILILSSLGIIQEIKHNTLDNVSFEEEKPFLHYIDQSSHRQYTEHLKEANMSNNILGIPINIKTSDNIKQLLLSLITIDKYIYIIGFDESSSSINIIQEIATITNEQANTIRSHYTNVFSKNENDDIKLFEEITALNNELINTKRSLHNKNNELETLYEKQRRLSLIDFLTEIPNRRKFFEDIYTFVQIQPYILTMMDFNNFKIVNDKYGHSKGDELLESFTKHVQESFSNPHTTLYRLGGDEFAILTPVSDPYLIKEHEEDIDTILHQYHPSVSIAHGSVTVNKTTINETHKAEKKMHEADKLMYEFKQKKKSKSDH